MGALHRRRRGFLAAAAELPREILLTRTSESFGVVHRRVGAGARAGRFDNSCSTWRRASDATNGRHATSATFAARGLSSSARATSARTSRVSSRRLGAEVHGVSRSGRGDPAVFASVSTVSELPALAATADWLIVTVPLTSETRGLIGRDVMSACRGAVLINAGRGAVVDEAMIPEALDNGWLAGAILDVFTVEPLPASSPLWDDPRVMISPHISGPTTADGAIVGFLECLEEMRAGETPGTWSIESVSIDYRALGVIL